MLTRASTRTFSLLSSRTNPIATHVVLSLSRASFSFPPTYRPRCPLSSASPYPLYYELISYRPPRRSPRQLRSRDGTSSTSIQSQQARGGGAEGGGGTEGEQTAPAALDRSKTKYYRKRTKRMYGESDSEGDGGSRGQPDFVELDPEVVDFPRLHAREEELYFYDAFSFPWEKEKHYRMVYQLEKKYFPDQCLDKAFVDPGPESLRERKAVEEKKRGGRQSGGRSKDEEKRDERSLIFFDHQGEQQADKKRTAAGNITEKKVEEFFKCLKKIPSAGSDSSRAVATDGEPFLVSRKTGLPPKWDGPSGTVVLVDKPKGWTSFTVCGKLRRQVKVQKVGHTGTLDPMATGLLIVCVGKATKLVERYQGMVKGYSGMFRLGEATSTWDADSPVIQREPWEHIKDDDIKKVAASFCGEIWQVPPMFSAIKVGGEKMYEKARRGETVELSPRRISIFQFDIERSLEDRQNLIFRVTCSKGTYIRSLCADLGKALGSCAHLTALRRDLIGQYSVDDAWEFQELQEQITKSYF